MHADIFRSSSLRKGRKGYVEDRKRCVKEQEVEIKDRRNKNLIVLSSKIFDIYFVHYLSCYSISVR